MTTDCDPAAAFPPSPVPSDTDLWLGELPFTAWGQHAHGRLDLRAFDQATWWVDIAQQPHRLEDMSDGYVGNVIEFLVDDAEYFHGETLRREWLQICGDLLLGRMSADLVAHGRGAIHVRPQPDAVARVDPTHAGATTRSCPADGRLVSKTHGEDPGLCRQPLPPTVT